jgi:hypothetical protein
MAQQPVNMTLPNMLTQEQWDWLRSTRLRVCRLDVQAQFWHCAPVQHIADKVTVRFKIGVSDMVKVAAATADLPGSGSTAGSWLSKGLALRTKLALDRLLESK